MKIHFIIHEVYEGPGALLNWAKERGYATSCTRVYLDEPLPKNIKTIDVLIVLGGPQNPATRTQECEYFKADDEIAFIKRCIDHSKAVVGICLGAQLIGEALGARYAKSPNIEIGYFPIELTESGAENSKLSHFNKSEVVGHWHEDMPGLTPTSKVLANSAGCPRQIVEYTNLVYGFQCHLEFTTESIKALIDNCSAAFDAIDRHQYIQKPDNILSNSGLTMNALLCAFMDKLMQDYA